MLTLDEFQEEQREWSVRNFGAQAPYRQLLGVVEEAGELCHAHLKGEQGIRGTDEQHQAAAKDAIGDLMVYLVGYCSDRRFNLQDIVEEVWAKVKLRDWQKNPQTGVDKPTAGL